MSHSMYSADRGTHLRILVVSLLCATLVAMVGVFAHVNTVNVGHVDNHFEVGPAPAVQFDQRTMMSGHLLEIR